MWVKNSKGKVEKGASLFDIFNYAINILEDSQQLAIFESTKMNKLRLSHQAIDVKEVNMYIMYLEKHELHCFCEGLIGDWGKKKNMRDNIWGMYCVLDLFWGLLPIYLLKCSRKTIGFIWSDLFVDKLKLRTVKWFDFSHCCNKQ